MKGFIQHPLIKAALAVLAAAVPLLAVAPAQAGNTYWIRGGNWASLDAGTTQIKYPDGITSTTTPTQASNVADTVASDYYSVGINFVRFPIDPATVVSNWPVTQACINELVADGLDVDICCFYIDWTGTGVITNYNDWETMWQTVDGVYSNNNSVYYEPINEPFGYSESDLADNVYYPFLNSYGIQKAQNHIILDGSGYADDVTVLGGDSRFSNCLLAVHDYPSWAGYTTESQWESQLQGEVGSYASRTILTEFGAVTITGLNYDSSSSDSNVCFIRGITSQCRYWMGSVYFPAHEQNAGNGTTNPKRLFIHPPGSGVTNQTMVDRLQYGWGISNRMDVFAQQSDGYLYTAAWIAGEGWTPWSSMGKQTIGGAAVCCRGGNELDVFAINTSSNLVQRVWTPSNGWSGWYNWGGTCTTDPAVVSRDPNHVDVFVGDTAHACRVLSWDSGSGWNTNNWTNLGGTILAGTSPGACSLNTNELEVYVVGTNGNLFEKWWNGSSWSSSWLNLGGVLTSSPSPVALDSGTVEVFGRATTGACYVLKWTSGSGWGSWIDLGGSLSGGPGVCTRGNNVTDVYARSTSNTLYDDQWIDTGTWTGWYQLDTNTLTSDPAAVAWTHY